jgi:hypothetical protein
LNSQRREIAPVEAAPTNVAGQGPRAAPRLAVPDAVLIGVLVVLVRTGSGAFRKRLMPQSTAEGFYSDQPQGGRDWLWRFTFV